MKKKIIILFICILLIVFGIIIYKASINRNYTIPENYKLKLENNMSQVDGPDKTYYVYDSEIIIDEISYYPLGHSYTTHHIIMKYMNIDTDKIINASDIEKLIQNVNGKKILEEKR